MQGVGARITTLGCPVPPYARHVITDPEAVRVLCFGDSNTYGTCLRDSNIEETLNGRTTHVDYDDRPGCNGRSYFVPCLLSHRPLDVVVVMLGGNDLKPSFHRAPTAIAEALGAYVDDIAANVTDRQGRTPMIVLVGPIRIDDTAPKYRDLVGENFDPSIPGRSRELATEIRRVARERGTHFADAAEVACPGDDGLHLSQDSHARLAELIASTVMQEM
jgi:lysophospholipase L1-like esterase